PIDVQESHFVATRRIWLLVVTMHSEKFVKIWERFWTIGFALLGEKNIRPAPIHQREIKARSSPRDTVLAVSVAHTHSGLVPYFEFLAVANDRTVSRGHRRFPALCGPEDWIAGKFSRLLDGALHARHRSDE